MAPAASPNCLDRGFCVAPIHDDHEHVSSGTIDHDGKPKEGGDDDDDDKSRAAREAGGKTKKLTNQFNFSERASQTYNNPCRVRALL